jgi:uncharacterized membrane protein
MRAADGARLVALAAIWGASFLFIRILAPAIGPVATADLRMLIAGGALAAYFSFTGFDPGWRRYWRYYLLIGVLNSAAPFVLFGYAALDLSVGLLVVFNATSPMWGALLSALALRERLSAEPAEMGVLLTNLAFALLRAGEVDAALASSRRALALFEASAGASPALLLSALVSAADLNMLAKRWTEAEALLDRALGWAQRTVGENHRLTATVLSYQAVLCKATHRKKEGAALENRATEIRRSWLRSAARQEVNVRVLSELEKPRSVQ